MSDIVFPSLSKDFPNSEGVVATWLVTDGEHVNNGQLIAEVEVDKVTAEVFAPHEGTVQLLVREREAVIQNTPIARIE